MVGLRLEGDLVIVMCPAFILHSTSMAFKRVSFIIALLSVFFNVTEVTKVSVPSAAVSSLFWNTVYINMYSITTRPYAYDNVVGYREEHESILYRQA